MTIVVRILMMMMEITKEIWKMHMGTMVMKIMTMV